MVLTTQICFVFAVFLALDILHKVDGCTYLTAYSYTETFDSHSGYGSSNYDNNMDECWVITTNSWTGMVVKLETVSFNTEHSSTCSFDYVKLYDSSTQIGESITYCGYDGSFTIYSSGSSIYVRFETDGSTSASGFSLRYSEVYSFNYDSSLWTSTYEAFSSDSSLDDLFTSIVIGFWAIVGIVIGSIILFIIIVIVIIVVVVVCIIGSSSKGAVTPGRTTGTTVVQNGQVSYMNSSRPGGAVMVQPPTYGQQQYGYANPGYTQQTVVSQGGNNFAAVQQQQYGGYNQQLADNRGVAAANSTSVDHPQTSSQADDGSIPPPPVYHDPGILPKKY